MIHNIPFELQRLNQWVVATGIPTPDDKEGKAPIHPRTGKLAKVTDPSTWGSFQEACSCNMKHVGFVLSKDDPYTIIDLDDPRLNSKKELETDEQLVRERTARHAKILQLFESYAEYSQSGTGVHIIVKGKVPKGCRKDRVEVYSDSRYMICTGNPYNTLPITDQQALLDVLFAEMSTEREEVDLVQIDGFTPDDEICRMAYNAVNGSKFWQLWQGEWQGNPLYPSQSEADFALLSIIAFYTRDNAQVRRIFRASVLGQREKAQRNDKYLNYALRKIRAEQLPPIDFSQLLKRASRVKKQEPQPNEETSHDKRREIESPAKQTSGTEESRAINNVGIASIESQAPQGPDDSMPDAREDKPTFAYPPGFIGDLAEYFYASAVKPVREISMVSAMGLMSGVLGRSFNISNTGVNQYFVLVANTGVGKEGISNSIESIISQARMTVPGADTFVGPANFASGQALIKVLQKQPCFVSVLGEFGIRLREMCDPKANAATQMLMRAVLDLYNKSGFHNMLRPSVYSDSEKNTLIVQGPNVSIIGETTPSTFYDQLDISHLQSGLIPRLIIIEYTGDSPKLNKRAGFPAGKEMLDYFANLCATGLSTAQNRTFMPVQIAANAEKLTDEFNDWCRTQQNEGGEVEKQLWSRAHLKALRMCGLIAATNSTSAPVVDKVTAEWVTDFVASETHNTVHKFKNNEFGSGIARQNTDMKRVIKDWINYNRAQKMKYGATAELAQAEAVIPFFYLRNRVMNLKSFTEDRRGADVALEQLVKHMTGAGILEKINEAEAFAHLKMRSVAFAVGENYSQMKQIGL